MMPSSHQIFPFQPGMRGLSLIRGTLIGARFIWRDDKWWHLLIDPVTSQPNWIRVKVDSLENWTPDLEDPATSGIISAKTSLLTSIKSLN